MVLLGRYTFRTKVTRTTERKTFYVGMAHPSQQRKLLESFCQSILSRAKAQRNFE